MAMRLALILIFAACQITVAFAPFLPYVSVLYPDDPTPREHLNHIIAHLGIHVTILTAFIAVFFELERRQVDHLVPVITSRLSRPLATRIRDDEFYERFLALAQTAGHYVLICYFAPYPPADVPDRRQRDYYEELRKVINRRPEVKFRRIARLTPTSEQWIASLVEDMDGRANASLAAIEDTDHEEMPIALSVQIIDGRHAWIVAIEGHQRTGNYRDLYIEDELVAEEFAKYHKRLWEKSRRHCRFWSNHTRRSSIVAAYST